MINQRQVKEILSNLLAFGLLFLTFFAVHSMSDDGPVSAEGQLSRYYGPGGANHSSAGIYPGDLYPGDNPPLYPGDEKWDGLFNPNIGYATVSGLSSDGTYLYGGINAVPYFGDTPYVAGRWQENQWNRIAPGVNGYLKGQVFTTAFANGRLYIGGRIDETGSLPAQGIAFWNGAQWNNMLGGVSSMFGSGQVRSIAISGENVYVGGSFQLAGSVQANNIARWDGSQWHALGSGLDGMVYAIAVQGTNIYAGGSFLTAGQQAASRIMRWDGAQWLPVGGGTNGTVYALAVRGSDVYAGGSFSMAGSQAANNIARWDGLQWHALGSGIPTGAVYDIEVTADGVYAGGPFRMMIGAYNASQAAFWNGSSWSNLGSGLSVDGGPNSILALGSRVYFSGGFSNAGNNLSSGLAAWNLRPRAVPMDIGSMPVAPGSTITLFGRYLPPRTQVNLYIDRARAATCEETAQLRQLLALNPLLMTDEDGKVSVRLSIGAKTPPGEYHFTFKSGETFSCGSLHIQADAEVVVSYLEGDEVIISEVPATNYWGFMPMLMR